MARMTLPGDRWVELRPMYVTDELAFEDMAAAGTAVEQEQERLKAVLASLEAAATDEEKAAAVEAAGVALESIQAIYFQRLRETVARMTGACLATSWGGPLPDRVTRDELYGLVRQWRLASEDDALPPANGTSSETP